MPRQQGSTNMTPHEDQIAFVLFHSGLNYVQIAEMMKRTDRAVASAVERAANGEVRLTKRQAKHLDNVRGLRRWLDEGERKGFLEVLSCLGKEE
jgi:transcriptional regulator